jgi:signal peptidase I
MMSAPQPAIASSSVMASLYIQAIRQGQSVWFRVVSGSMVPILHIGDSVHIKPAKASEIHIGEIAAFETHDGLVVHRIIQHRQTGTSIQLLEMGDADLRAGWVEEQAVVGRVVAVRHGSRQINLLHRIARRYGAVTAYLRFWLYRTNKKFRALRFFARKCSRLVARLCCWRIRASSASFDYDPIEK